MKNQHTSFMKIADISWKKKVAVDYFCTRKPLLPELEKVNVGVQMRPPRSQASAAVLAQDYYTGEDMKEMFYP